MRCTTFRTQPYRHSKHHCSLQRKPLCRQEKLKIWKEFNIDIELLSYVEKGSFLRW